MNYKKAFTLAEVLITLSIVGIVAALTIPDLTVKYKKQETVNKLKKVYSTMNNAMRLSESVNGEYSNWESSFDIGTEAYFEKYWQPYIKSVKICKKWTDCGYGIQVPWIDAKGEKYNIGITSEGKRVTFVLPDGSVVMIMTKSTDADGNLTDEKGVYIDINGPRKPNQLGKDVFIFRRYPKIGIVPLYYDANAININNRCKKDSVGDTCAAKILKDGWEIKEDYAW